MQDRPSRRHLVVAPRRHTGGVVLARPDRCTEHGGDGPGSHEIAEVDARKVHGSRRRGCARLLAAGRRRRSGHRQGRCRGPQGSPCGRDGQRSGRATRGQERSDECQQGRRCRPSIIVDLPKSRNAATMHDARVAPLWQLPGQVHQQPGPRRPQRRPGAPGLRPSTGYPRRRRIVDNLAPDRPNLVDKSVAAPGCAPVWFVLPEGAGGTDAGPVSDRRTGFPNRRRGGRKVDEVAGAGTAATRPSLLGSGAGVSVRYGSFGRFRVRRTPRIDDAQAVRRSPALPPSR